MMSRVVFDRWWHEEGSGITPEPDHDMSEHTHRVSEIAWSNGEYLAVRTMEGGIKELTEQIQIRDKMISALQGDGEYEIRYLTWRAPALLLVVFVGLAFLLSRFL